MTVDAGANETSLPPHVLLQDILQDAVQTTIREAWTADDISRSRYLSNVRNGWLRSLREAFAKSLQVETNRGEIVVFGGKPRDQQNRRVGVPTGIYEWRRRWEFQYDVSVFEVDRVSAPFYRGAKVPVIRNAIWLVESEIAGDGKQVAEDVSKLRISKSKNTLLIAARTTQKNQINV